MGTNHSPSPSQQQQQWDHHPDGSGMPYSLQSDDYDDADDLTDLLTVPGPSSSGGSSNATDRVIRRRSSKACDQCRKSKCKCERGSPSEPCKACIMLGTQCTFLGPSRKRGPPKGYIDAIEARLHQTEALVGILLAVDDVRAKSLLDDLSQDPLANDIIKRVDNSPYGPKGRARAENASISGSNKSEAKTKAFLERESTSSSSLSSTHPQHPSHEWQDTLSSRLTALAKKRGQSIPDRESEREADQAERPSPSLATAPGSTSISMNGHTNGDGMLSEEYPRQRRRIDGPSDASPHSSSTLSSPRAAHSTLPGSSAQNVDDLESDDEDQSLVSEVGQLSLNEERELRFHGKASGLHLLNVKGRVDGRSEGGIWRFPKARVWPPLPNPHQPTIEDEEAAIHVALPDAGTQEALLELYFTYVHPSLPVVHKQTFLQAFRMGNIGTPPPNASPAQSPGDAVVAKPPAFVSRLLLLVMYSIAARFRSHQSTGLSPIDGSMWPAGDEYYNAAQAILARTHAAPRASTCQALILMGYREVGIGAMAQAWLYIGMAIRMAHDLGLHKCADRWAQDGASLFAATELQERRRIWSACIIMDKYVSTYIGRPVYIHEVDFDTELPDETEAEELEEWRSKPSTVIVYDPDDIEGAPLPTITVPARVISCFNATANLATITGRIVRAIYAIRAGPGRHAELLRLEEALEKWYLDLPEHLRLDPATSALKVPPPPPHVLTMHAGYWTVVILLHRPFIRYVLDGKSKGREDPQLRAISQRNYDLCVQAANHITSIISLYEERYCLRRGPVFLCYYVFTAAIMHVITLNAYPDDPQAQSGLKTCMHVLHLLDTVWPSAQRAWELLNGSRVNLGTGSDASSPPAPMPTSVPAPVPAPAPVPMPAPPRAARPTKQRSQQSLNNKRSAETFLADDARFFQRMPAYTTQQQTQTVQTSSFYSSPPSYERWGSSSADVSGAPFSDSLSTSGLPQQYSTGYIDRLPPPAAPADSTSSRYPQYWTDYAALNPLGVTYGGHDRQQQPGQGSHSLFGLQDPQYHMYGP